MEKRGIPARDKSGMPLLKGEIMRKNDYKCNDCGEEFTEGEAVIHFAELIFTADMDACPECDSEDLEELKTGTIDKVVELFDLYLRG